MPDRKLSFWPPPSASAELRAALAKSERPGVLSSAHQLAAMALFLLTPLGKGPGNAAFAALMVIWLLRLPALPAINAAYLRTSLCWAGVAWFLWAFASGLWTPDHEAWVGHLGAWRALLLVPALAVIAPRWQLWAIALLIGVNAINLVQILQEVELLPPNRRNPRRHAAYGLHPGHFTTWCGVALLLGAGLAARARGTARRALVVSTALALVGMAIGAGRGAMVGLATAAPIFAILMMWRHGMATFRRALVPIGVTALLAILFGGAMLMVGGSMEGLRGQVMQLVRQIPLPGWGGDESETDAASSGGATSASGMGAPGIGSLDAISQRRLWYAAALELAHDHPIRGGGLGYFAENLDRTPSVERLVEETRAAGRSEALVDHLVTAAHPHSVLLHTLVDLGAIGVAVALGLAAAIFSVGWTAARVSPVGVGVLTSIVLWFVASLFESLHLNGMMGSLLAMLTAMGLSARWSGPP